MVIASISLLIGGQSSQSQSDDELVQTLIENVRAENKEMISEETDGDLYESGDYELDPNYEGASE